MIPTREGDGLLEAVWRIRMPSGAIIECGIYRCVRGCFEARIAHQDRRLASQCSFDLAAVREAAEAFRLRALEQDGYTEVSLHLPSIEPFPGGRIVRRRGRGLMVHTPASERRQQDE